MYIYIRKQPTGIPLALRLALYILFCVQCHHFSKVLCTCNQHKHNILLQGLVAFKAWLGKRANQFPSRPTSCMETIKREPISHNLLQYEALHQRIKMIAYYWQHQLLGQCHSDVSYETPQRQKLKKEWETLNGCASIP